MSAGLGGMPPWSGGTASQTFVSEEARLVRTHPAIRMFSIGERSNSVNSTACLPVIQFDLSEMAELGHARMLTMELNYKKLATSTILWSLVWALAIIATAFLFKGNPAKDWIET